MITQWQCYVQYLLATDTSFWDANNMVCYNGGGLPPHAARLPLSTVLRYSRACVDGRLTWRSPCAFEG